MSNFRETSNGISVSNMLFSPGMIFGTPAAMAAAGVANVNPIELLHRHLTGDWGDVSEDDAKQNIRGAVYHNRVVSAYQITPTTRILIITEADRSATTILTPEDY